MDDSQTAKTPGLLAVFTRWFVKPFERKRPPSKKVAILIPMSSRPGLTEEEEVSMRQLLHHLGSYDKFLLAPKGMKYDLEGFEVRGYPHRFFGSGAAHGRLLGTRGFYRGFLDYDYVFFYHLDSLAFGDELADWCDKGIDYIGPPWIRCEDSPWVKEPRVGNGGFTLLRVDSALKALTNRYLEKPAYFWYDLYTSNAPRWMIGLTQRLSKAFPGVKLLRRLCEEWDELDQPHRHNRNNDIFWSDMARRFYPDFKVASLEEGLRFAFEVSPKTCYEMNGGKLPFGCHAWAKYDPEFWKAHLVPEETSFRSRAS
ncbi:MAG: hypothetical protein H7A50_17225 [Akkermansiaceae bacterium]|nr:hypothetical protein [Akkermansiaceae bacterium]